LRSTEVRIALLGAGPEKQHIRQIAAEHRVLDRNLFILDEVAKSDVVGFLGACDLALSTVIDEPALHANSANKVFDAFAAGRPVGINHEGWLADLLRTTGAGIVLPAGDASVAAGMVADFVCDPHKSAAARTSAKRVAVERFDREQHFRTLESILMAVGGVNAGIGIEQASIHGHAR
jgi:glycosyltransferase involved in cell wall biosynthesis